MERFRYLLKARLSDIPKAPGVYALSSSEVLYIGKAANLRDRVKNHFQQPTYRDDLFIDQVTKVGYIKTASEIEALLLESQLIKKQQPKYNVMWKDGKQYLSIGITKEELPRIFLTHQPTPVSGVRKKAGRDTKYRIQNANYVGPFVDGKALKRTLRSLRKVFPYYTVRTHGSRLCQYCHLGLCPGPNPDKQAYQKNVRSLQAVLEGKKISVLKKLQQEMRTASKQEQYERAGKLRDQIQDLEVVFLHAKVLRPEEEKAPLQWEQTEKYLQKIFNTKKNFSRVEAYDISNIQGVEATGSMPVFIDGKPAKEHYKKFKVHISGSPNDFAMMEEVLTRRLAHKEWGYPDLMVIDGGKGQLSSVLKAFKKYTNKDIQKIHVVAIAKKHNELFLPGKSEPLLLKNMPQDVSNLILHIRDEAHRFAISYHRKLRTKKLLV